MGARAARAGVMLRRMDALDNLKRIVADAAWQHRTDYDYLAELATWSGRYASTAGVPARSTPQPDATAAMPARTFAGGVLVQSPDADPTDDNAVVIALGTAEDDTMARLRASEATSLVLLTATALGLASCPITEPLEVAETRAAVQADVFGEEAYRRCCCASDGRRSTLIRCRPRRAAICRKWLHGWTVHRWADG